MATRAKSVSTRKVAAGRSSVPAPAAAPAPPARKSNAAMRAAAQIIEAQKTLLRAGLRVLRVDLEPAEPKTGPPQTMEEVFDRRVAGALQRLGMPDAAQFAQWAERLEAVERKLDALHRQCRPEAPPRR